MNWFYESAGQQQGPVSDSALDALLAEGKITPNTLVWHEGMADWKPMREARPSGGVPPIPGMGSASGDLAPGYVRCSLTGKVIPESEAVYIQGKPYSAEAKPAVLQGVQQSGSVPVLAADRNGPPWEHRQEIGFFKALWATIRGVLIEPSETFAKMRRTGGFGSPLLFFILVGTAGTVVNAIYQLAFQEFVGAAAATTNSNDPTQMLLSQMTSATAVIAMTILAPIILAISSFISSGITHLSLMICGGAKQPFETTFRVLCYAYGSTNVLQLVPFCGALIQFFWSIVAMSIGLSKTHEVSIGRAVLAVLLPIILCCGAVIVLMTWAVGATAAAVSQGRVVN